MEHDAISEKIAEKNPAINIDEDEMEKFLLIFHLPLEAKEEDTDNTDGVLDIIVTITKRLIKLLQDNIDSLNIADKLKKNTQKDKIAYYKRRER